jgi:hypothetical protein
MPMMRSNYDLEMKNKFAPDMEPCTKYNQNTVIVSRGQPITDLSCMSGYPAPPTQTKENFSQGLSFNDPNNIWSYTGDINCQATCSLSCDPYPMSVSNCGGSFDIVRGAGCADTCSGYSCGSRPVTTCSNYIYNPYQNTTCGCRSGCGGGRTCSSCSK